MKISIKECLQSYGSRLQKAWEHDRLNTVGASEVGQCIRKTWFSKNEAPADPDYEDRFGAKLRGTIIEDHYWVPGLRASLPEGVELLYAGSDQRTLVDGYLSATPDGLLVGCGPDALAHFDIDDLGSDCLAVESKSIDPRVDIRIEKPEHSFQTQAQMGLLRFATEHKPNYALISYVDASFLDDVREFAIPFDQRIYDVAKERARRVFTTDDALTLPPEGKLAGGNECGYCPWKSHCAAVTVAGIPKDDKATLGENAAAELKRLRDAERDLAAQKDTTEIKHATAREAVKEFLRINGIRRYTGEGWAVSWSSVKSREIVDTKAAEAAGVDLTAFKKVGDPADRLLVK
jgi:hypothetical protein